MTFVRRVETGHDARGRAAFLSDGAPPKCVDGGRRGVAEVFSLDGPPLAATDGGDSANPEYYLEPPPGGTTVRIIKLPPTGDWLDVAGSPRDRVGWHTTHTLDVEVVLAGEIVLELDDGEHHLGAGDTVVQRGTGHRWKVVGDEPCTYLAVMLAPETGAPGVPGLVARGGETGVRRLVTGVDGDRSVAVLDAPAPVVLAAGDTRITDIWQTGGPLASIGQGGDPEGPWALEPAGAGVVLRTVELGTNDPGDAGWHTTDTIDIDVVMRGSVSLALPDLEPVILRAGDVVLQRATRHKWLAQPGEPFAMASVMFGLRH